VSTLGAFFHLAGGYRKLRRYKDIAATLARHGFGDIASRTGLARFWHGFKWTVTFGHAERNESFTTGERLRLVCEQLGPTFIKFGQMLANRPDMLPPEVIRELAQLQDRVPPFPADRARSVIEKSLGRKIEEVFDQFEETPIAAASIAQVHKARLKGGQVVAVKVRRPDIEKTVREDLAVLNDIASYLATNVKDLDRLQPGGLVEEFARTLRIEMDFANEVQHMERFASNFRDELAVRIPAPVKELCGKDLIVMEFLAGVKVTDIADWSAYPVTPKEIADLGTRLLLRSVFEHRFYHADPHPGNFLIGADGKVCLLDFGMMGYIEEARIEELLSFMVGLVSYNSEMLVDSILQAGLAPEDIDRRALKRDLEIMMDRYAMVPIEKLRIEPLLRDAVETVFRHRILLPSDLLGVGRALSTMEGIARRIYPQFNPLAEVQPYLVSLFLKRALNPSAQSDAVVDLAMDWASFARDLPRDVRDVLQKLRRGELSLRIDDRRAREETAAANRRANRLAGTLMGLAGSAGSALLLASDSGSPLLAYAGLAGSVLVLLWVLSGIHRSGGM
jgi:ubiquinone biosynthesis protein